MFKHQSRFSAIHFLSLVIFIMCYSTSLRAQVITYTESWGDQGISLEAENSAKVSINFSITQFQLDDIDIDGITLKAVHLHGVFLPNNEGAPDLAGMGQYIALPQGAEASFKVISSRIETISNVDIAPAPRIPKDTEVGPLVYTKN